MAVICMVLAFVVGFAGVAVGLEVTQPLQRGSTATVEFQVAENESATAVANSLKSKGLIHDTLVFKLLARYRHLQLKTGLYKLSPAMTMDAIIGVLNAGISDQLLIGPIPPGKRVTEYTSVYGELFAVLPNFNPADFLKIAASGTLDDGTKLSSVYWYAPTKGSGVQYTLEGYLFPDTLYYAGDATAGGVIERMLADLGEQLCPGPDAAHLDAYLASEQQCKAHAKVYSQLGKQTIFQALDTRQLTLAQALTLASIVEREARSPTAKADVASVYYNRFLAATGAQPGPDDGGPITMDADPTVQYATGTTQDPWPTLQAAARTIVPDNPFNTYTHPGLPPGPICGVDLGDLMAVLTAPKTDYYYFIFGSDHQNHYAHDSYEQQQNIAQYGTG
jgi:UPF0755 protein